MALLLRHLVGAAEGKCSSEHPSLSNGSFKGAIIRYKPLPQSLAEEAGTRVLLSSSLAATSGDLRAQHDLGAGHSPGAVPPHPWHDHLQLHLFKEAFLWRAALVEFVGTLVNTFWSVTAVSSVNSNPTQYFYPPLQIGLLHAAIISITILATARSSGGHLNSLLTFATWAAGLTEFPRLVLYIPAQIAGSTAAAYIVKSATPEAVVASVGFGGCYLGELSTLSGFVYELFFSLVLLFVAFGIALDESQRQVFGPIFGPLIIGVVQGSIIYISPALAGSAGYTGASCNPSRCIGPAFAWDASVDGTVTTVHSGVDVIGNNAQWIYWVGPFTAGLMIAVVYRCVPPSHMDVTLKSSKSADDAA